MVPRRSRRGQGIGNLYLPPRQWLGRHDIRVGLDVEDAEGRATFHRNTSLVFREDGTLSRRITFVDAPQLTRGDLESGFYGQDRWSPNERLLVEAGFRVDRDHVVPHTLFSPRVAASWVLTADGQTKITAGAGLFYDRTRLDFITRPHEGQRIDSFFAPNGT